MKPLAGAAALCCVLAITACDQAQVEQKQTEMARTFMELRGLEYDMRLEPASADPRGALVVTRSRLSYENAAPIPLYQVGQGVYRTPSLRSWYGAKGAAICDGQPVGYVTLHKGAGGLYYLNAGNWSSQPALPGQDAEAIPGACETTAYRVTAPAS